MKGPWTKFFARVHDYSTPIVRTGEFERLHLQVYDIVENILKDHTEYDDHPFVRKWKTLQCPHNKNTLTSKMGWCMIKMCLGIKDLGQYKDFIL